jgi:hypothetical protein
VDLARKGGDGWENALLGLGLKVGSDLLPCVAKAALGQLTGSRAIGDGAAIERLNALVARKGWK